MSTVILSSYSPVSSSTLACTLSKIMSVILINHLNVIRLNIHVGPTTWACIILVTVVDAAVAYISTFPAEVNLFAVIFVVVIASVSCIGRVGQQWRLLMLLLLILLLLLLRLILLRLFSSLLYSVLCVVDNKGDCCCCTCLYFAFVAYIYFLWLFSLSL